MTINWIIFWYTWKQ